jgi:uncharacterized membrane protein YcaP (DUF421 family)
MSNWLSMALGLDSNTLSPGQMATRAAVAFAAALALLRVAGIRTLGKQSAFDALTALILGSVLGRAIVDGAQPFFGCLLAALVIVLLHRLMAWITFHSSRAGALLKGRELVLVKEGQRELKTMRRSCITDEDILEAMREKGKDPDIASAKVIHLERSGNISIR